MAQLATMVHRYGIDEIIVSVGHHHAAFLVHKFL